MDDPQQNDDPPPGPGRYGALAYRSFGTLMLALAVAGLVLPGLPAMPFVLLAAWAFGRGDPTLARRLEADPRFGPMLVNWRTRRAVPTRAKVLAVLSMTASIAILWASGAGLAVVGIVSAILVCVAAYLVSRPSA